MALGKKKTDGAKPKKVIKPVFLAAFIGLGWVALYQGDGSEIDAPEWGIVVIIGARMFLGFVAGWVVISLVQVVLRGLLMGAGSMVARVRRE